MKPNSFRHFIGTGMVLAVLLFMGVASTPGVGLAQTVQPICKSPVAGYECKGYEGNFDGICDDTGYCPSSNNSLRDLYNKIGPNITWKVTYNKDTQESKVIGDPDYKKIDGMDKHTWSFNHTTLSGNGYATIFSSEEKGSGAPSAFGVFVCPGDLVASMPMRSDWHNPLLKSPMSRYANYENDPPVYLVIENADTSDNNFGQTSEIRVYDVGPALYTGHPVDLSSEAAEKIGFDKTEQNAGKILVKFKIIAKNSSDDVFKANRKTGIYVGGYKAGKGPSDGYFFNTSTNPFLVAFLRNVEGKKGCELIGTPMKDPYHPTLGENTNKIWIQEYQKDNGEQAAIIYKEGSLAYAVFGDIYKKYQQGGGYAKYGAPTGNAQLVNNVMTQNFEKGKIPDGQSQTAMPASCPIGSKVCVCSDVNGGGQCSDITPGENELQKEIVDLVNLRAGTGLNKTPSDGITSIYINGDYKVTFYEKVGFKGMTKTFSKSSDNLWKDFFDGAGTSVSDVARSLRVGNLSLSKCGDKSKDGIYLYSLPDKGEGGECSKITDNVPDLDVLQVGRKNVNSIEIKGAYELTFYENLNYGGANRNRIAESCTGILRDDIFNSKGKNPIDPNDHQPQGCWLWDSFGDSVRSARISSVSIGNGSDKFVGDPKNGGEGVYLCDKNYPNGTCSKFAQTTEVPDLNNAAIRNDNGWWLITKGDYKTTLYLNINYDRNVIDMDNVCSLNREPKKDGVGKIRASRTYGLGSSSLEYNNLWLDHSNGTSADICFPNQDVNTKTQDYLMINCGGFEGIACTPRTDDDKFYPGVVAKEGDSQKANATSIQVAYQSNSLCDGTSGVYLYKTLDKKRDKESCTRLTSSVSDLRNWYVGGDNLMAIEIINDSKGSYVATLYADINYETVEKTYNTNNDETFKATPYTDSLNRLHPSTISSISIAYEPGSTPTDNSNPNGFLDLPIAYTNFGKALLGVNGAKVNGIQGAIVTSWFDHDPKNNGTLTRFDRDEPFSDPANLSCKPGYNCYDGHEGIDFYSENHNIYAAAKGKVLYEFHEYNKAKGTQQGDNFGQAQFYGNYLILEHGACNTNGDNYRTLYAHLTSVSVKKDDVVESGQPIGIMGNTGNVVGSDSSDGTHLHFGVYCGPFSNYIEVDPYGWLGTKSDPYADFKNQYLWKQSLDKQWKTDWANARNKRALISLTSPADRADVSLSSTALPNPTTVQLGDRLEFEVAPDKRVVGNVVQFSLPEQSTVTNLNESATLTMRYLPAEAIHLDLNQLALYHFDTSSASWHDMQATVDPTQGKVVLQTTQLGHFSLQAPLLCPADSWEMDDAYYAAYTLEVGGAPSKRVFDIKEDEDWFKFEAQAGVTYQIKTENLSQSADTVISFYDTDGFTVLATNDNTGQGKASSLTWQAPTSGLYFIKATPTTASSYGCQTTYDLRVTQKPIIDEKLLALLKANKVGNLVVNDNMIYLGTKKGLIVYNATTGISTTFTTANSGLLQNNITDLELAPDGTLWILTPKGINQFNGTKWDVFEVKGCVDGKHVRDMAISPKGMVWLATQNAGLVRYDGKTCTAYTKKSHNLPHDNIKAVAVGADEIPWITLDGKDFGSVDESGWQKVPGSPKGNIDTLAVVGKVVYLGTQKGLVKYAEGKFDETIEPFVNINKIVVDSQGWLWVISESGQTTVQRQAAEPEVKVGVYNPQTGQWLINPLAEQTTLNNMYLPLIVK